MSRQTNTSSLLPAALHVLGGLFYFLNRKISQEDSSNPVEVHHPGITSLVCHVNLSDTSKELEDLLSHCICWVHDLEMLRTLESQEFCSPGCALKIRKELSGCLTPGHQLCWVSLGSVIWVLWEEREQVADRGGRMKGCFSAVVS